MPSLAAAKQMAVAIDSLAPWTSNSHDSRNEKARRVVSRLKHLEGLKFLDHGRHRAVFAYEGFAIKVPTCEDGIKANKFEWDTYHTASPCGRRYLAKPYALCGRVMVVQMYEFEMYTEAEVAAWYARLVDIFGDSVLYDITPHNLVALKNNHPKLLDYS